MGMDQSDLLLAALTGPSKDTSTEPATQMGARALPAIEILGALASSEDFDFQKANSQEAVMSARTNAMN
jgi:hypothetical protein